MLSAFVARDGSTRQPSRMHSNFVLHNVNYAPFAVSAPNSNVRFPPNRNVAFMGVNRVFGQPGHADLSFSRERGHGWNRDYYDEHARDRSVEGHSGRGGRQTEADSSGVASGVDDTADTAVGESLSG